MLKSLAQIEETENGYLITATDATYNDRTLKGGRSYVARTKTELAEIITEIATVRSDFRDREKSEQSSQ